MKRIKIIIKQNLSLTLKLLIILLIIIILSGFAYLYSQNKNLKEQLKNPNLTESQLGEQEVARIIGLLGKLIILPSETPTVYIISNPEEAANAYGTFFNSSKVGDRLVIYKEKAIIYRESENIIVNVGPIAFRDTNQNTGN